MLYFPTMHTYLLSIYQIQRRNEVFISIEDSLGHIHEYSEI